MKALLVTLLIFAGAFTAYDFFLAPPGQKMIFKSLNTPAEDVAAVPAATESGIPVPAIPQDQPPASTQAPAETPPTPAPAPSMAEAPPPVPNATGFAAPKFEPLDELAKGWTFIPKTAFPRQVRLKKAVPFKMSVGSSNLNEGTEVTALGFKDGNLALAPTPSSAARAIVPLDDTDLKAVLYENYEKWKALRLEAMKAAYEKRIANKASQPPEPESAGDSSQAPTRAGDGSYPLLVAHLNSGEVNEIKAKNIKTWGEPVAMKFEGKSAWSVKIQFEAETVFGLQPVEAQAVVSGNRVKGWFYTGSGEQVP